MSNDERPVPDISISTAKPNKNPLGYTITYHENELTFSDGSTENEMLVSSSGKILSGSYKIPDGLFAGWYSDKACTKRVEVDSNGIPVDGVSSDLNLYAKSKTFTLKSGPEFNVLIPSSAISIVFTDEVMPASATLIEVDADGDGGVVAWTEENETVMKVSTQMKGLKAQANTDSSYMFYSKSNLKKIDLTMLDTRNVTNMRAMFSACSGLADLDLTPIDTSKVINMRFMFDGCSGLTSLNLTNLDTKNVTNMDCMFRGCSGLTALDLSHLDTRNVTSMTSMFYDCSGLTTLDLSSLNTQKVMDMGYMFSGCTSLTTLNLSFLDTQKVTGMNRMFDDCDKLTSLSLGEKFAFVGSDYRLPSGTWYASDGTAYTSNGKSCTIPNNKADTYTRR